MGLHSGGLIIGGIFAPEIWGACFREGLLSEFYGICLKGVFGGLIFGRAYTEELINDRNFAFQNGLGFTIKTV